jgi:demethylphylloquinone reductase
MTQAPRICILGGGFGGLYTALRLGQFTWESGQKPEITLVDRQSNFLFTPLLYEIVTGELQSWEIAPPFTELLRGTDIRFIQGVVSNIDVSQKQVKLADDVTIPYDRLVLALGSENLTHSIAGVEEHAIGFRTIEDAYSLDGKLRLLEAAGAERIRIAIVGAGYSGVELACKLADRLGDRGRIRLVEAGDKILPTAAEFNRKAAETALEQRGVWIDLETTVGSIAADTISLVYKGQVDPIPVEIVLWTAGTQVNPLISQISCPKNQRGRILVMPTLQVPEHPEIFAVGDTAEIRDADDKIIPATAQSAFQQADFTAWNLWSSLTDRPLLPFSYTNLGEMMALGTDKAVLSGLGMQLDGELAYLTRRLVYLYRLPTLEHQLKVGFNWLTQPLVKFLSGK